MSSFKAAKQQSSVSFDSNTLLVPLVSVGNGAQLAADLLIATYGLELQGSLSPRNHVPVTGQRENGTGFFTPVEVYQKGSLAMVHQRSPPLKNRKDEFIADLVAFIKSSHFSNLLILACMDGSTRRDRDLASGIMTPLRHVSLSSPSSLSEALQAMSPAHQRASASAFASSAAPQESSGSSIPHIPAGGITRKLLDASKADLEMVGQVNVAALLMFLVEGDNRDDARTLASATSHVLQEVQVGHFVAPSDWLEPPSWKAALYGGERDQSMF